MLVLGQMITFTVAGKNITVTKYSEGEFSKTKHKQGMEYYSGLAPGDSKITDL